jgi:hypothetical protein
MILPMIDVLLLVEFLGQLARRARLRRKSPGLRIQFAQRLLRTYANPSLAHNNCLHLP